MLEYETVEELKEKLAKIKKPRVVVYFGTHEPAEPTTDLVKRIEKDYGPEVLFVKHPEAHTPLAWFRKCHETFREIAKTLKAGELPENADTYLKSLSPEKLKIAGQLFEDYLDGRVLKEGQWGDPVSGAMTRFDYNAEKAGLNDSKILDVLYDHLPDLINSAESHKIIQKQLPEAQLIDVHGTADGSTVDVQKKRYEGTDVIVDVHGTADGTAIGVLEKRYEEGNITLEYLYSPKGLKPVEKDHHVLRRMAGLTNLPGHFHTEVYLNTYGKAHTQAHNRGFAKDLKKRINRELKK